SAVESRKRSPNSLVQGIVVQRRQLTDKNVTELARQHRVQRIQVAEFAVMSGRDLSDGQCTSPVPPRRRAVVQGKERREGGMSLLLLRAAVLLRGRDVCLELRTGFARIMQGDRIVEPNRDLRLILK